MLTMVISGKCLVSTHLGQLLLISLLFSCSRSESFESKEENGALSASLTPTPVLHSPSKLLEENNSIDENENDDEDDTSENNSNKFSWRNHEDDHSIYAGRSLMSAEILKQHQQDHKIDHNSIKTDLDSDNSNHDDEEFEALKTVDYAEKEWQLMFRAFDLFYDSVSSSLFQQIGKQTDIFQEIVSKLAPECRRDLYHVRDSVKKHRLWALRMLDSNGKLPSGITYGRFSSPGDYEECLSVRVDELVYKGDGGVAGRGSQQTVKNKPEYYKFHGKYCLLDFRLPLPERPRDKLLSVHESVLDLNKTELIKKFPEFQNFSGYASVFYEAGFMHAMCLPSTCDVQDLAKSVGNVLEGLHIIVNNTVDCEERSGKPLPLRTSQIISLVFLFLLFLNAFVASLVHYLKSSKLLDRLSSSNNQRIQRQQPSSNEKLNELKETTKSIKVNIAQGIIRKIKRAGFYSECFSIQTNLGRLTKPDPRGLTFVHYTRIIAMALTVITHTAGLGTLQAITKPADTRNSEEIFRDFIPQMLANAFTSIQIFFFMAGFMLVISTYPSIKREKGHMSFLEYIIKRAIRLMPGIAATISINFLWPLVVDGPMLSYFIRLIVVPCETKWWRTMFFLSNFDHVEKMCLRHSYFSASDYQLHVMAFPLLLMLYKQPAVSLFIAGLLTVAGFAAQIIMILTKTVVPFIMIDYIDMQAFFNVVHYIHHPVWNHASAFFYGFIIGYLVVKQIRIEMSERTKKILWFTLMPAGIISIFAPYFWNHYKRPIYRWQMVLYVVFDRLILLTTCAWLSYATMVLGRKPPPKKAAAPNLNLPNIVSIEHDKEKLKSQLGANNGEPAQESKEVTSSLNVEQQQPTINNKQAGQGNTGMPRQRSSPNILTDREGEERPTVSMRQAISSVGMSKGSDKLREEQQVSSSAPSKSGQLASKPQQDGQQRSQAPISNLNTLCLILSRLTFQLYLFNMVVLWIDVNNSKFPWFFSYYFIITKAAAVYVCSSLMAMIFFITLESPSLSLYITWVKSRAQARANRREQEAKMNNVNSGRQQQEATRQQSFVDQEQIQVFKASPESLKSQSGGTFDGLCMRSSTIVRVQNSDGDESIRAPVFSFIDLSAPPISVQDFSSTTSTGSNDQTKI